VREWGGIGFFLGGIGPDGHIAFNMPGSAHDSTTRLVRTLDDRYGWAACVCGTKSPGVHEPGESNGTQSPGAVDEQ
jgi:6-phosphogluconolactonase/glucosamine-6-phosphate isomerase/deaminase